MAAAKGRTEFSLGTDAQRTIGEAVELAVDAVRRGAGELIVVSCHAVIHELYDRSEHEFDLARFLGTIFGSNDCTIWFTCREPGTPEKWPTVVLVRAACSANSLLELANAIALRHGELAALMPQPHIFGDGVRLHKTLGMELLAKLFYLDHLSHEIQERSSAVDHSILQNTLLLAIGDTAVKQGRASVKSMSASTVSFDHHWRDLGIEVSGLDHRNNTIRLGIAESQTRLVGWRCSLASTTASGVAVPQLMSLRSADKIESRDQARYQSADVAMQYLCLLDVVVEVALRARNLPHIQTPMASRRLLALAWDNYRRLRDWLPSIRDAWDSSLALQIENLVSELGPLRRYLLVMSDTLQEPFLDFSESKHDDLALDGSWRRIHEDLAKHSAGRAALLQASDPVRRYVPLGFATREAFQEHVFPTTKTLFDNPLPLEVVVIERLIRNRIVHGSVLEREGVPRVVWAEVAHRLLRDKWAEYDDDGIRLTEVGFQLLEERFNKWKQASP